MTKWNSGVSSSHQIRAPTFFAGIRVYKSQGLSMNFACEAPAVGNRPALFLGALLWYKHELTKDFVSFKVWILQQSGNAMWDVTLCSSQMHSFRVAFTLL